MHPNIQRFLTTGLCASVLWMAACHREGTQPQPGSQTAQTPPSSSQDNELRPEPRSVTVQSLEDLAAWERQLQKKQEALDVREQQVAERERAVQGVEPPPASQPQPVGPGAQQRAEPPVQHSAPPPPPEPRRVTVPAGARLPIELAASVTSKNSRVGQRVRARVTAPVHAQGLVAIPGGSELVGTVTEAGYPRRLGGRAIVGVRFTTLVLPSGKSVPISASYVTEGRNRTRRSAAIVGGSTAGGAILGHNVGHGRRGTLIGGLIGAVVGSAVAANTQGPPAVIPGGTVLHVKLQRAVTVPH
jgi:hypothetical protein